MSLRRLKESYYKVTECMYHCVYISKKVVLKLRNVYITACTSQGKVVIRLRNVYITACTAQEKPVVIKLRNV